MIRQSFATWAVRLAGALAAASLAGCAADRDPPPGEPSFYRSMASAGAQLDAATAASMISGYRRNNGLTEVTVDPALMQLAEAQARAMAGRDKLDHNVIRGFSERIKGSGYDAKIAVENIGAGYHTLAEAFSGWRDLAAAPRQHAADRRHPPRHRRGLCARLEIQGVLGAHPRRPGRPAQLSARFNLRWERCDSACDGGLPLP